MMLQPAGRWSLIPGLCLLIVIFAGCGGPPEDEDNWLLYPEAYEYPVFSPDGSRLLFFRRWITEFGRPEYNYNRDSTGIWEMELDSLKMKMLYKCDYVTGITPSPDGSEIVFSANNVIKIMRYDGRNVRTLTEGIYPAWSRSGNLLAYCTFEHYITSGLYVMNSDGSNRHRVLVDSTYQYTGIEPRWMRDNRNLMYISVSGGVEGFYIVHSGGGSSQLIYTEQGRYSIFDGLSISPDGYEIAFREGLSICVANWQDFSTKRAVSQGYSQQPNWSPDGRQIVYIGPDDTPATSGIGVVWIMNKDGSGKRQLTTAM